MSERLDLRVIMGSCERRGVWTVPAQVKARVLWGNMELDLREAELGPDTTIDAHVTMGNLEVIVPRDVVVDVTIDSIAAHVDNGGMFGDEPPQDAPARGDSLAAHAYRDPAAPAARRLRVTGKARMANCEIIPLGPGETIHDHARRLRQRIHRRIERQHRHRHHHHHQRHQDWLAEKELWKTQPGRAKWLPWWLQAQMRRRIFTWFAIAFAVGVAAGVHLWGDRHWWHFVLAAFGLFMMSGFVSWRLTRPLLLVVRAARDIGDGKLDTRLPARGRGEMRVLATAINDMASRIEQQLKDQRQLLAAVSHELRTPLGHMRVLVETARTKPDPKILDELDREVMTLDDLVGRLLASSRLEFGNLDRRDVDLGELVSDVATSAGLAPETIEAHGDVQAKIDPTLVRRAVANLIDNARTHGQGAIAVRIVRRGELVAIEVDDRGPGVPSDRRADAFRPFVPSTGGGLGLGLALVSRIATAHDGNAWIEDRPGGGARVGFTVGIA